MLKTAESIPSQGPLQSFTQPFKVNWFKSERKGLGKKEKSLWRSYGVLVLWCCGARSLKGVVRFPARLRALLRWFQSGKNRPRLGRMKKVWLFSN